MNDQMNQSQMMMNQPPQVPILAPPQLMNQQSQMLSQSQLMMSQSQTQGIGQSQMMNRSYGMWPPPPHTAMEMMKFPNPMKQQGFMPPKPRNWKGKKGNDMRKDGRRKEKPGLAGSVGAGGGIGGGGVYKPPTLNDLQYQNRLKARRFYPKKKFNNRFAPYAPRNTTSFLIRAKKSGGIASLVSPCPVTPAVLPTPIFSPSREVLGDMAKEEWGVDGYGSMKGLIRLRSPGNHMDAHDDEEEDEGGSSESDVEEHVEVERRLDHDLSRFEMIYPNYGMDYNNVLENRVEDQDSHIAQLEEENLFLKERLFLMEREMGDLRRRLQFLERHNQPVDEINEEVVDNVSENESEGREYVHSTEDNNEEVVEENNEEGGESDLKGENNEEISENECARDVHMDELVHGQHRVIAENQSNDGGVGNGCKVQSIDGGDDAAMEDAANVQGQVNAEDQSKDGVGNICSRKSIGDGDMSNCPALM
ncbi:Large tegument protein like [Actinidia chinensis var. chinensis]|uniref:Large tegument protein like n=1 Tax=Actinidia chinensis var. chinensis TaxID=1590841 RepID=A0A2R6QTR1_ACTCC|nr:Large tegument protein like [Actinidia chinensis var. chinensis]